MSRIYFHQKDREATVLGSERAWLGQLTREVGAGAFRLLPSEERRALVPEGHFAVTSPEAQPGVMGWGLAFDRMWDLFLGGVSDERFRDGTGVWDTVLNTCMVLGGDSLKLAARIHAQCEIHGWVDGPDCQWLSHKIDRAVDEGIFREEVRGQPVGWEDVVQLLAHREPTFMSYSVCEGFPNEWVAGYEAKHEDDWYNLNPDIAWGLAVDNVRTDDAAPQLTPTTWDGYRFGQCKTAFDFLPQPVAS